MATTGHRARQTVRPSAARSDSSPMRGRYRHAAACRPTAHPGSDWRSAKARSIPETCLRLHDEIAADYNDMIYATTPEEIEVRRKAFIRKWRLKHRAVADSLEEAGERLFTFTRLPPSQWRSVRTTNAIERLHEEFKRRIKTQTVLPSADTAAKPETIPSCYRRARHTQFQPTDRHQRGFSRPQTWLQRH